jgi:aminopeptidase
MAFDNDGLAALVCDWCLEAQPGQTILIQSSTQADPIVSAIGAALLERGAWSLPLLTPADWAAQVVEHGQDRHFDEVNPMHRALFGSVDTFLRVEAPTNTRELSEADPAILSRLGRGGAEMLELRAEKRWAITLWPTHALAQEAGMSFPAYERFVTGALFLDRPDPVAAWRELRESQQGLVDRLTGAREVRIVSERTDLTLNVTGRTWINSDGKRNMPSGEVFTSPIETSANGRVFFDVPSNLGGSHVGGIALEFVDGVVTEAHAEQGDEHLQGQLAADAGARRLGEIGIGTNYGIGRATGSTLLDEKIGGTIHLALGRSYTECGGENTSTIHWDIICDLRKGGEIVVDGEVISRDGQFV